jgi:hypothetical protein
MSIEEEQKIIHSLRKKNYTYQEIANKFGRSLYWVYSRIDAKYTPKKENKLFELLPTLNTLKKHYRQFPVFQRELQRYKVIKENSYDIRLFLRGEQIKEIFKKPVQTFGFLVEDLIARPILEKEFIVKKPALISIEAWDRTFSDPKVQKLYDELREEEREFLPEVFSDKKETREKWQEWWIEWENNHPLVKKIEQKTHEFIFQCYKEILIKHNPNVPKEDLVFLKESVLSRPKIDFFCIPKPNSSFSKPFYFTEIKGERTKTNTPSLSHAQREFFRKFGNKIGILVLWIFFHQDKIEIKWLVPKA